MKKLIFPFAIVLALTACKEKNDLIDLRPAAPGEQLYIDSSYNNGNVPAAQQKRVLIEDFTGVKCVNCPTAQSEAANIVQQYPGKVTVVSIHVTAFAVPYKGSKYDFRTTEGTNLLTMFGGEPNSLPQGDVDRMVYSGYPNVYVPYTQWKSFAINEMSLATPINLTIDSASFNAADSTIHGSARVVYNSDVTVPAYITMVLMESGIVDLQYTPSGMDSNYTQNHVLRRMIQPYNGLKLASQATKGQTYVVKFKTRIKSGWKPENMHLVAYVHQRENGDLRVMQVQEAEVK